MRSLLTLITLVAIVTSGAARAATGHDPGPPPAGYSGWLILYILPPPGKIDWTTPSDMSTSALTNYGLAQENVKAGRAVYGHPIGHVHVEMACSKGNEAKDIPLTGMTSDEESWTVAGDGLGILFRDYKGRLDHEKGKNGQGGKDNIVKDLTARKANPGYLGIMRIPITWAECTHLRGYFDEYVEQKAYEHFGSQFRARGAKDASGKHEGSGCAGFAVSFLDVAGLLPRPMMTQTWARQLLIGNSLIADFPRGRAYLYGSNLVATINGTYYEHPVKTPIPAVKQAVFLKKGQPWLTMNELTGKSYVPLTLYDPELMFNDLAAQWLLANLYGNPRWKAFTDGKALGIELKRPACPAKEKLKPFIDEQRDLTKD